MLVDFLKRKKRSVSLIPLIDVVFILLLFFMLSTSLQAERELQIHFSSDNAAQENAETRVIFLTSNRGTITLGDQRYNYFSSYDMGQLKRKLTGASVAIDIAPDVRVQPLVSLLDRLKLYGFNNVSLLEESG